ncbi:MAG: sulfurtransferase [bacterium]
MDEWSADDKLPLEHLPRFRNLVPPEWVKAIIDGEKPEEFDGGRVVICHNHYRNPNDYDMGHIPGAISVDTLELEESHMWNRRSPEEIEAVLKEKGIDANTTVIMYGRFTNPDNRDPFPGSNAGHIGAHRNALIMLYAGVRDVRIINGGLMAWERLGYPTEKKSINPVPVDEFGVNVPANPNVFIDIDEAKEYIASEDSDLVSIRSWDEFIGEKSGYNYIDIKGRIPGAVFGNCGSDAYHMENFRNHDHTTLEYSALEKNWLDIGITPNKNIAFYCGTGWRASEAFFNAYYLGWNKISVFDGGWMEWSNDPNNPIETGVPK